MADGQNIFTRDPHGSFGRRPITTVDDRIWQGAFKARARSGWMGLFLGIITGAGMGALFAFLPFLIGITAVAPAVMGVLACAGVAASIGAWMASDVGAQVGASAGAVTSGTKEVLSKEKDNMVGLLGEMRAMEERITGKPAPPIPKQAFDYHQDLPQADGDDRTFSDKFRKYFNLKVGLLFLALGAGVGAVAAFAPATPLIIPLLNTALMAAGAPALDVIAIPQLVGLCSATGAIMGSIFSINYPVIANKMTNVFGTALSGNWFEKPEVIVPSSAPKVQVPGALQMQPALKASGGVSSEDMVRLEARQAARAERPKSELIAAQKSIPSMRAAR